MIYEISFAVIGGVNITLENKWKIIERLIKKYPQATWKKIIDLKKGRGKYIIQISQET
jgi:hypothetical protein